MAESNGLQSGRYPGRGQDPTKFSFLGFPAEIRNQIYPYALKHDHHLHIRPSNPSTDLNKLSYYPRLRPGTLVPPGISLSCRQLYAESIMLFRSINSFDFSPLMGALYVPRSESEAPITGDLGFRHIRLLQFHRGVEVPPQVELIYFLQWNRLSTITMRRHSYPDIFRDKWVLLVLRAGLKMHWTALLGQLFDRSDFSLTLTRYPVFAGGRNGRPESANVRISKSPDWTAEGVGARISRLPALNDIYERALFSSSGTWAGEENISKHGLLISLKVYEPSNYKEGDVDLVINGAVPESPIRDWEYIGAKETDTEDLKALFLNYEFGERFLRCRYLSR